MRTETSYRIELEEVENSLRLTLMAITESIVSENEGHVLLTKIEEEARQIRRAIRDIKGEEICTA